MIHLSKACPLTCILFMNRVMSTMVATGCSVSTDPTAADRGLHGLHTQAGPSGYPADIPRLRTTLPTESASLPAEVIGKPQGRNLFSRLHRRSNVSRASKRNHRLLKFLGKPMPRWRGGQGRARKGDDADSAATDDDTDDDRAAQPKRQLLPGLQEAGHKLSTIFQRDRDEEETAAEQDAQAEQAQEAGGGSQPLLLAPKDRSSGHGTHSSSSRTAPTINEEGEALTSQESMMPEALQRGRDVHVQARFILVGLGGPIYIPKNPQIVVHGNTSILGAN